MRNRELLILTIIFIIAVSSFSCKSQEKQYYKSFGKIDYKLNTDVPVQNIQLTPV